MLLSSCTLPSSPKLHAKTGDSWAATTIGVVQAAHTQWFIHDGDLATTMSESLAVLERGISTDPRTWTGAVGYVEKKARTRTRPNHRRPKTP